MKFKRFFLEYTCEGKPSKVHASDFSIFDNEEIRLEFLHEELGGDIRYKALLTSKKAIILNSFTIACEFDYTPVKDIFCNGFQSWTETRSFAKNETLRPQRKLARKFAIAYGDGTLYDYKSKPGVLHSWTYTYMQLPKRKLQFLGSLHEETGYTIFEHHTQQNKLIINKDCKGHEATGEITLLDIFASQAPEWMCFRNYFEAQQLKPIVVKPAIGWTSWYYYYTQISEKIISENLEAFKKHNVPIGIFQVDDGWQKSVGDWLHFNDRFPNGLSNMVESIHARDIRAGLWLAPLACEHNSFIVRENPGWILKDEKGEFLKIGFNPMWSYWFYALDLYNQEVREYLKQVFDTVFNAWKFDLVKLDFLYGTALVPRNGRSRSGVMHDAMQFFRSCAGDKMILGCGVPLSAAIGTTEYCRIGPDIHLTWDFTLLKWIRARERPSVRNAIHNTISRRHLSGKWFWNDPDVFLLRENKNKLNFNEKYSLLLANLLFGHLIFTSDNISEYDEQNLFLYKSIFPLMPVQDVQVRFSKDFYTIRFAINDKFYLALINTSDESRIYKLTDHLYFDNVKQELVTGGKTIEVEKHSSKCFLVVANTPFAVAGSHGHFFSGTEIENIYLTGNKVELEWAEGILNDVKIYLKVPVEYPVESINNSGNFTRIEKKDFSIIEVEKHKL